MSAGHTLPTTTAERKAVPLVTGVLDYFPAALAYVARISKAGNDKHNPGQPMHHARGKSMDHADCIGRHLVDRGTVDPEDNLRHSGKVAWRALALLQEELEREEGAPLARAAVVDKVPGIEGLAPELMPVLVRDFIKEAIPMPFGAPINPFMAPPLLGQGTGGMIGGAIPCTGGVVAPGGGY